MNYEQKYKDLVEAVKQLQETNPSDEGIQSWVKDNVPELRESEDDKVREELIRLVKKSHEQGGYALHKYETDRMLAWLEKQGEQKSTYMVEPKFHKGDFIKHNKANIICKVISVNSGSYFVENIETGGRIELFNAEQNFHLWTIQDAKDGDVLVCESGWTCIFKTLVNNETFSSYCFMDNTKWFSETGSECHTLKEEFVKAYNGKIYPATKEQRDLLFAKMRESGYKWDAEKKELKLLITNGGDFCESENCEQKPAKWGDEDENRFNNLIFLVEHSDENKATKEGFIKFINKLKSIKQRHTWKPSKEQIIALRWVLNNIPYNTHKEEISGLLEQIKKL